MMRRGGRSVSYFRLALCTLPIFAGCHHAEEEEPARPPVPVRVATAEKRWLRPSFMVIGTVMVDPQRQATLSAATPGLVDKLVAREGAKVREGELVVQLDERKARVDLEKAEAALARLIAKPRPEEMVQARASLDKAQAAYDLAQTRLKKSQKLRAQNA